MSPLWVWWFVKYTISLKILLEVQVSVITNTSLCATKTLLFHIYYITSIVITTEGQLNESLVVHHSMTTFHGVLISDVDECASHPCMNNATCVDGVDSYKCTCLAGYFGYACETGRFGLDELLFVFIIALCTN